MKGSEEKTGKKSGTQNSCEEKADKKLYRKKIFLDCSAKTAEFSLTQFTNS